MENATKALMMAAGVLIGILVASFMVLMLRKAGSMSSEYDSQISDNELAKFNGQFEIYDKDDNTFFDVITVSNLAYDVNKKNGYDEQNSVTVKIFLGNGSTPDYSILPHKNLKKNYFFNKLNPDDEPKYMYELVAENTNQIDGKYEYRFDCIKTGYNTTTGKVNEMQFKREKNQ